jgi:hypothetical protein
VSHVIVLFDFIEEQHERGEPLPDALIDAGALGGAFTVLGMIERSG